MISLMEYLFQSGVLENGTQADIDRIKKEYRQKYLAHKREEYKTTRKRKEIVMTPKEFSVLMKASQKLGVKVGTYIKKAALSYTRQEYLLPEDSRVSDLEIAIRRIGNNLNQIAQKANISHAVEQEDMERIRQHLNELEAEISRLFRKPDNLLTLIRQKLAENPGLIHELQALIHRCTEQS